MIVTRSRSFSLLAASFAVLVLLGQGCVGSKNTTGADGGIFRTKNLGTAWDQLKVLNLGSRLGSIANVGTTTIVADPQDPLAIYAGSIENGLIFSLDGGESWAQARGLSGGRINAIAVDPKDKCTVYASRANQIFKTDNCGRDWNQTYFDPRANVVFNTIAVDWFNSRILYAGTSIGDILRSDDGAQSWRRLQLVSNVQINHLIIDPRDSRVIYVATNGSGILKSIDAGATWTAIYDQLKDFDGARRVTLVAVDPSLAGTIYATSKFGIIRSDDGGASWKALTLPTPSGSVDIKSMLVHPKNSKALLYATNNSLVLTDDSGATWTSRKLPTTRGVAGMVFDSSAKDPGLFVATTPVKK